MPKASEWMINLSLFTVRDFCIAEFACVLQDWNRYIWGICWVNTSCCWASHALSLYGARLMLAQLESLHYLFSNEELNMQVCVCLFHMSLNCCSISQVSFSIPCVTFFSLVKRSLSQNTLIFWSSTLFFCAIWIFQDAVMPTRNSEPQAHLNKELQSWVLLWLRETFCPASAI